MSTDRNRFEEQASYEAHHLAQQAQQHIGEDNVVPWLRVHRRLVEAALRGYRVGRRAAIERAEACRN